MRATPTRARWSPLAYPLAALVVFLFATSTLYPLRPDAFGALAHPLTPDPLLAGSWGGPTLLGAWLAHAAIALVIQVVCVVLIRRLNARKATP